MPCSRVTGQAEAYHLFAKEVEALERSHRLRTGLYVSKHDVCLTSHTLCSCRIHIQNGSVGRKEHVKGSAQVRLPDLLWQVRTVKPKELVSAELFAHGGHSRLIWGASIRYLFARHAVSRGHRP